MAELNNHTERAHALLSASSAYRWLECPRSAVAVTKYADEPSPYAAEGTLAHEVAEWVASGKDPDDLDNTEITPEMINHAREYSDYIKERFDGSDDRVFKLETKVDFSPWVPDGFGTCDAILVQGFKMDVFDYKYGIGVPVSAVENPQMKLYALGAMNDYGIMLDVDTVEMHIFQPRINNVSSYAIPVKDLFEWADKTVKPVAKLAAKGKGSFKAGVWCRFCPHAAKCRALAKTCTDFVELHGARQSIPSLAPFEVAEVLKMEPMITNWLKRVKAQALADLLDGKDVPGFKAVEGRLGNRKWSDEDKVIDLLVKAGYGPEDYFETKLKSPAGIDSLVGKKEAAKLLADVITREQGAPMLVSDSDSRQAITNKELLLKDFD